MEIGGRARQVLYNYTLTPAEDSLLTQIAETQLPCRGYARGLLYLLKGERFPLDEDDFPDPNLELRAFTPEVESASELVRLYPNPASNQVILQLLPAEVEQGASYRILDATGQEKVSVTAIRSTLHEVELSRLPSGIYFLELRIEGSNPEITSIAKL
jgi:hypothetical protein